MCTRNDVEHLVLDLPETASDTIEALLADDPEPEHHIGGWVARAQTKTVPTHDGTGGGHFAFVR
jgi:hypothetical protein